MEATSQISVWVPILVGLLGVLGVIAGQFVNAWREDRRWKREREVEAARIRQEDVFKWREIKLRTYSQFLGLLQNMHHIASEFLGETELPAEFFDRIENARIAALDLSVEVSMICSKEVLDYLREHEDDLGMPLSLRARDLESAFPDSLSRPTMLELGASAYRALFDDFRVVARTDLQLPHLSEPRHALVTPGEPV